MRNGNHDPSKTEEESGEKQGGGAAADPSHGASAKVFDGKLATRLAGSEGEQSETRTSSLSRLRGGKYQPNGDWKRRRYFPVRKLHDSIEPGFMAIEVRSDSKERLCEVWTGFPELEPQTTLESATHKQHY